MAPTSSDPKDLKLLLNPARRKALAILINSIISYMRSRIELSFETTPSAEAPAPLFVRSTSDQTPESDEEARQQRLEARLERSLSTKKLQELKKQALIYFDNWAREVRGELRKTCEGSQDPRSEQRRREWQAARATAPPPYSRSSETDVKDPILEAEIETKEYLENKSISILQTLYPPIPTRLTTISIQDRIYLTSSMVLLLLSLGHYSAHSRVLLCYLTSSLSLPLSILTREETEIARTLLLASKALTADAETQKRQAENASARRWKVGLASLAGAAVIGVTGGLATPIVAGAIGGLMGTVGLGGVASFIGIFAMNGALVGSLFGAYGAKMTGDMVDNYAKEVEDFKFLPVAGEWGEFATKEDAETEGRRLRVTIGINGWLNGKDDVVKPWRVIGGEDSEVFALRYEMEALIALGTSLQNMVSSYTWSFVKLEILKRTVLATLWSALWPVYLLKMATSIDNPFAVARNRSEKAGEVLADAIINKAQGERPVTLVGYSLGARVIYSCLKSLADRQAFGLVENVVFIGSPIPSATTNWRVMRSVVSGKLLNVYSENDYILAFLYRATSMQYGVAGLQKIKDLEEIGSMDLTKEVSGHLRYPDLVGKILKRAGFFEDIKVENEIIEGDVTEISLVDVESESLTTDTKLKGVESAQMDLLGLMDNLEIDTQHQGQETLDLIPGMTGLNISAKPAQTPRSPHQHQNLTEVTHSLSNITISSSSRTPPHSPLPRPSSQAQTQAHKNFPLHSTSPAFNHPQQRALDSAYDSDSDTYGIQMVDNEDDEFEGELEFTPSIPIPDDDDEFNAPTLGEREMDGKDSGKVAEFPEQKILGSLREVRRGGDGPGNGGRIEEGRGKSRVADFGLL